MRALRKQKSLGLVPAFLWLALQLVMTSPAVYGSSASTFEAASYTYADLCLPSGADAADLGSQDHDKLSHCPWCRSFVALSDLGVLQLVSLGQVPLKVQGTTLAAFVIFGSNASTPLGSRAPPLAA